MRGRKLLRCSRLPLIVLRILRYKTLNNCAGRAAGIRSGRGGADLAQLEEAQADQSRSVLIDFGVDLNLGDLLMRRALTANPIRTDLMLLAEMPEAQWGSLLI